MVTRAAGVSKEGTAGQQVQIVSNFFKVEKLPNNKGIFQYNVSFDPDVQSPKLKGALLHDLDDVIGKTRCFDGMTMFLPIQLTEDPLVKTVTTRQGNDITIKIMFKIMFSQCSMFLKEF